MQDRHQAAAAKLPGCTVAIGMHANSDTKLR